MGLRQELTPLDASMGRPSVDPDWMIRMLIVGYCLGYGPQRSGLPLRDPSSSSASPDRITQADVPVA
jgi:hypothetical protein